MPRSYRINVRFDPGDPEEAEVLSQLRHMVISRYDEFGKRHRQWKSTELPALEKHKNAAKKCWMSG